MKNKELRVAEYVRWEEGDSPDSIYRQDKSLRDYIKSKGWRVVDGGIFVDVNVPPVYEYQLSLQDFVKRADDFDVLVVKNVEVLGTHAMTVFPLISRLKIMGVDIHYSDTGADDEKQALEIMYLAAKSALEAQEEGSALSSKEVC